LVGLMAAKRRTRKRVPKGDYTLRYCRVCFGFPMKIIDGTSGLAPWAV